ncbi:MAG: hypothetical protein ABSA39_07690 [Edaphobacter sp.]
MKTIAWPSDPPQIRTESPNQFLLPELELDDSDYEAATKAFQNLDDCFFEVVFVREVAARHCRERQLRAALSYKTATPDTAKSPIAFNRRNKAAPNTQFDSYEDWFPLATLPKKRF